MKKIISTVAILFASMSSPAQSDALTDLYVQTEDVAVTSDTMLPEQDTKIGTIIQENNITADSWVVATEDGTILQESNSNQIRSIASISKLVTAMIVLDAKQDLDKTIKVKINKHTVILSRKQILQIALVRSNNSAAEALCNNYVGGRKACIASMNKKVSDLGLINTHFADPTGLNKHNVSTARELVSVVIAAQNYPEIVKAASTRNVNIKVNYKNRKHKRFTKTLTFRNTNHDAGDSDDYNFIVSKTGYIRAAGACIVMMVEVANVGKRIVVLLNSKNTHTRVPEAEYIASVSEEIL